MKVIILGLGWLGKDLALKLIEKKISVIGTKRTIDVTTNINQIQWNCEDNLPIELEAELCIITLSPSAISDIKHFEYHLQTLKKRGVKRFIYTSSTGVYEGLENVVDEQTGLKIITDRQKKLIDLENIVLSQEHSVVLRLGGLVGDDRIPAKFLAGKKNVSGSNQVINMIHKTDVINIITLLLSSSFTGIMNAVSTTHPTREEYYLKLCDHFNLERPEFNTETESIRMVSNELSKKILAYNYVVDDTLKYFTS